MWSPSSSAKPAAPRLPGANVAAVTTLGYTGFLVMPVILGFVANSAGLTASLVIVLAMGLAIFALSLRR